MNVEKTVLANGLTIISENNDNAISTLLCYWVKTGGHYEVDYPYGTAHFFEHMLFKGTTARSKDEIAEQMDECGGRANAVTSSEHTRYYTFTPYDKWREGLEVLTDMMFHSVFPVNEIELEKKVVLEEIKRAEDDPRQFGARLLFQKLREAHPERAGNLGNPLSLASLTRDHLLAFQQQYYQPGNMTFIATGRIEHAALVEFLTELTLPAGVPAAHKLEPLRQVPLSGETVYVQRAMKQAQLHWGMYGPFAGTTDMRIGSLISNLLGGSQSSRLRRIIRSERGLAYSVSASSSGMSSEGFLHGYVALAPEQCAAVQQIIIDEYERLKWEPVPEKELQKVKNAMIGRYIISQDSKEARNGNLAYEHMYNDVLNPLVVSREIERITVEEIQAFAKQYFGQERMLFIQVGP